jgi:hypothetical protein
MNDERQNNRYTGRDSNRERVERVTAMPVRPV